MILNLENVAINDSQPVEHWGDEGHLAWFNNDAKMMNEVMKKINIFMTSPELLSDSRFNDFVEYIKSLKCRRAEDQPDSPYQLVSDEPHFIHDELPAPSVKLFGHHLSRNELMDFIEYIFTNREVELPKKDPRVKLIGKLATAKAVQ